MRKLGLSLLFFIFLINPVYAFLGFAPYDIDVKFSFDSKLIFPAEGDTVKFNFILTPYNQTNKYIGILYILDSPENQSYKSGFSDFSKDGTSYSAFTNYSFDSPGVWTLNYFVLDKDYAANHTFQDIRDDSLMYKKKIHVLSYYEANSMIISNNSYNVSIYGLISTIIAFLLGICLNYIIDNKKLSSKIKVNCLHGFVDFRSGTPPVRTFSFEAINYGRTAVTLSSMGLEIKDHDEILTIIESEIIPIEFPKELTPGKSFQIIKNYQILMQTLNGKVPKRAFFVDQTNKKYYSKNIEKMFREH
ncbi:MAG: hypothetical protein C3F06_00525 [Candidatus Methanoperedenaceae archaeon]|nr:MAG: hypothetical protein C3F06_00525 [Candidatus Methanoperedenaceae archaeon]